MEGSRSTDQLGVVPWLEILRLTEGRMKVPGLPKRRQMAVKAAVRPTTPAPTCTVCLWLRNTLTRTTALPNAGLVLSTRS